MQETPKCKSDTAGTTDVPDLSQWSEDQKKRGYYYDDAYGYEVYDPAEEPDGEETENDGEGVTS